MENSSSKIVFKECCVIGCGISGIALSKWLKVNPLKKTNKYVSKIEINKKL